MGIITGGLCLDVETQSQISGHINNYREDWNASFKGNVAGVYITNYREKNAKLRNYNI